MFTQNKNVSLLNPSAMNEQIAKCYLHLLPNGAHFAFMHNVLSCAQKDAKIIANEKLAPYLSRFNAAFAQEEKHFGQSKKSAHTDKLNALDIARGQAYMAYKTIVKGYAKLPVPEVRMMSKRLLQHIKDYRISVRMQRDSKSGLMSNFIDGLEHQFAAEVAALRLERVVQSMKEENENYIATRVLRTEERMNKQARALFNARQQTDAAYRSFVEMVNAFAVVEGDGGYADFIAYMNTLISQYKKEFFSRSAASSSDDEENLPDAGDGQGAETETVSGVEP